MSPKAMLTTTCSTVVPGRICSAAAMGRMSCAAAEVTTTSEEVGGRTFSMVAAPMTSSIATGGRFAPKTAGAHNDVLRGEPWN
jgi:hypothetical protein